MRLSALRGTAELCAIDVIRKNCVVVDYSGGKLVDREILCIREIGTAQDRAPQERAVKVHVAKRRVGGIGASQVGAAKRRTAKIGSPDEGPMNVERTMFRLGLSLQHQDSP